MKTTCLFYFVSQVLKLLFIKSYMIQLGFRWVLRRGLEARGKTFRITVYFSSNKMHPRSALQIAHLEMQLWLALKLYFKVSVADCSPQISGLHLAMLTLTLQAPNPQTADELFECVSSFLGGGGWGGEGWGWQG